MKKLSISIIIIVLISGTFLSCEKKNKSKSNSTTIDDTTIPIDSSSSFNMKNFIASFEQLFVSNERWAWDFNHDISFGKSIRSYHNYKIYGEIGKKVFIINHTYNEDGILLSSERLPSPEFSNDTITFTYKYDLDGYIVKMTKLYDNEIVDVVKIEYNAQKQLIKKIHEPIDEFSEEETESFTYNALGKVSSWTSRYGKKYEWNYSNGNMIEKTIYSSKDLLERVYSYEYNKNGLISKVTDKKGEYKFIVEYNSESAIASIYEYDKLDRKIEFVSGMITSKFAEYNYQNDEFKYCFEYIYGKDNLSTRTNYYEGTPQTLILRGYMVVDSRDEEETNYPTKLSVYDGNNEKLYYVELTIVREEGNSWHNIEKQWFKPDETPIDENNISENWVIDLVNMEL